VGSHDPVFEFWDPLISPGRMRLETSNFAQRWRAGIIEIINKKYKISSKVVMWGSRDPILEL